MLNVMHESTTDKRGGNVANGSDNRALKLTPRKPRTAIGRIIHGRAHAARVSDDLANGNEQSKRNCELETEDAIKSGAESQPADRRE
jgi:hypothetical protein